MRHAPLALRARWIQRWDVRLVLPCAVMANVAVATLPQVDHAALAWMTVLGLALLLGPQWRHLALLMTPVLLLLGVAAFFMALFAEGPHVAFGGIAWSLPGLERGLSWWLRGSAAVLLVMLLLASRPLADVLHAALWWRLPRALVQCGQLTLRFTGVLAAEWQRVREAALLRGWRLQPSWRSLRTLGWMLGGVLVRSEQRSQRV